MKVYVDELPERCLGCCLLSDGNFCNHDDFIGELHSVNVFKEKPKNCPLQSLTDYTKQVIKEVVEKIKKHIDTQLNFYNTDLDEDDDNYAVGYIGGLKWVKDVLDLMEGEYK